MCVQRSFLDLIWAVGCWGLGLVVDWVLSIGSWMLGLRCWGLGLGCSWILGVGEVANWVLRIGSLGVGGSILGGGIWELGFGITPIMY